MRKFIKKYYRQTAVILAFLCLIIFILVESYTMFKKIKEQSIILKQTQMDHVLVQEYLYNIYNFKKDAAYIHENNGNFNILLPDNDDEKVRLFSVIESIAQETGNKSVTLVVKKNDEKKEETKKNIAPQTKEYIGVTISLVGNYNDLIMFLQRIENMQYISDVMSITSKKVKDEEIRREALLEDEDAEDIVLREDLLKSDIGVVFYLDRE